MLRNYNNFLGYGKQNQKGQKQVQPSVGPTLNFLIAILQQMEAIGFSAAVLVFGMEAAFGGQKVS